MNNQLLLNDILAHLADIFATDRFPISERGGLYNPSGRPVQRIGLALEPWPDIANWVRSERLDALWLHRPWKLNLALFPADVGILMHHLPFDEHLTTGYNKLLANVLAMESLEELGYKQAVDELVGTLPKRPIGMIGNVPERTYEEWLDQIGKEFVGYDRAERGQAHTHERIAVVGAMNPALIHEAHERNVTLYLTGEYRKGTQKAVDETGMGVIAIGHRRTEEWGLRALGTLLREQWRGLDVLVKE
ncbi:Nif3-like dinuclear metal center hexameric protein [uncultured Fibrella sp.]|uniref:Nif3-like dinuclear metal center hexameric protein n=1 Tax=uncultured Fibrella sp. TaxID=1284596 RepID=UPI0035CB56BC